MEAAGIAFKSMPARDNRDHDIVTETFPGAFEFIEGFPARRVLVVCYGGVNRSGAVVVGFLALRRGVDLVAAVQDTMRMRGTILTNRRFRHRLIRAFLELGALAT